jgi:hypothetical protein
MDTAFDMIADPAAMPPDNPLDMPADMPLNEARAQLAALFDVFVSAQRA